ERQPEAARGAGHQHAAAGKQVGRQLGQQGLQAVGIGDGLKLGHGRSQSAWMPSSLMTLPKRSKSAALVLANTSGAPPSGKAPSTAILATTSGILRISLKWPLSVFTSSGGRP